MEQFEVEFYTKENGSKPAREFLLSLDGKMRANIARTIKLLEENGTRLRMPYSEHLSDGIFELRAKVGSDISRVLYFFYVGRRIILTNGFIKKQQKMPSEQIALAKRYRADFLSRQCVEHE